MISGKNSLWILLVLIVLGDMSLCYAQETPFQFSLGLTYWYPKWTTDTFEGSAGTVGPKLSASYKNFGIGLLYLTGDFDVEVKSGQNANASRQDIDIIVQYSINSYFSAGLGFKYQTYERKSSNQKYEESLTGVGVGIGAYYPISGTPLYLYGNGSYLPTLNINVDSTIGSASSSESGNGYAMNLEIGLGYSFATVPIEIDIGYRDQKVKEKDLSRNANDRFKGPVIEVSYAF